MDSIIAFLDKIPMATLLTIGTIVGAIIALANGSIDFDQFLIALGVSTTGFSALGYVRNQAGKGIAGVTPDKRRRAAHLEGAGPR